jgi:NHL repeat
VIMRSAFFDGVRPLRPGRFGVALVAVVGLWLSLGSASAFAVAEPHPKMGEFGSFSDPNGIAVDESTGDVYVADIGTQTVHRFDESGNPVNFTAGAGIGSNALTGIPAQSGKPAESFSFPNVYGTPAAIAVDNSRSPADPSAGDLYVMDAGHGVIDKFSASGEYLSQITGFTPAGGGISEDELLGLGVDAAGTVHVDLNKDLAGAVLAIDEFDDSITNRLAAKRETVIDVNVPYARQADGFTVGPTGDGYTLYGPSCSCALKFGQRLSTLGFVDNEKSGDVALAVDPATGQLFADDQSAVAEWDTGGINRQSHSSGAGSGDGSRVGAPFGKEKLAASSGQGGIAVDGSSGRVYVSNPADGKVYIFASDAPAVSAGAPSNVTKEAASVNATVDPRGASVTACRVEYGVTDEFGRVTEKRNGAYEHRVSCKQTASEIGAGSGPVPVSADLAGLEPGELYRFRVIAENTSGASQSSGFVATLGAGFGIKDFTVSFLNEDGTPDTQAGSHPYQLFNTFTVNSHFLRLESNADSPYIRLPEGTLRDVTIDLPPGLVGDPNATSKKCTGEELRTGAGGGRCPAEALVGHLNLDWSLALPGVPGGWDAPLYNMVAPFGVPVQLGTNFVAPLLYINSGLLAGGDYPVQVTVVSAPASAPVFRSRAVVFGVVGQGNTRKAFLTLPTGCHGPLRSTISVDSYQDPGHFVGEVNNPKPLEYLTSNSAGAPVSLTGCSKLRFPAEIRVRPDSSNASTSSGLTVNVHVPQTAALNPDGLAESALRDTTVALPEGVAINPSGGGGLGACTADPGALPEGALGSPGDQIGYKGQDELNKAYEPGVKWNTFTSELANPLAPGSNFCANGSKVGTVKIKTPLLEHELEGEVYLASQESNPFGSLIAMYIVAEDPFSGSLIKLAGEVSLSPTGQIVTTFKNTPDAPFENLELHFFGGERAPLATPTRCGTYTTTAVFTPWDGNGPVNAESSFTIDHGPGGSACPGATLPFSPTVNAGATNIQAGAFSPLTVTMNRKDGEQNLKSIEAHLPPGLSGVLTGVELCPEPQANLGECGPNSLVGEATIGVGVGNDPFTVTGGKFYLTGPYNGHGGCTVGEAGCAPFGLTFEVPAKAGPFDLASTKHNHPACDCVIVRGKIELDPLTAAVTITTDPPGSPDSIPTSIEGIPLEIQHVNATTTRGNFQFNPTSCAKMALTGTLQLSEGGLSTISTPFQVTNCAALKFEPKFSVSTSGKTSRANGASLHVKLVYPKTPFGSQANIRSVKVDLPKQLPSRLTTLQKACPDSTFNQNPAACSSASRIGTAKAITPLIPVPLEGPVYFVSHGGAKFPELVIVLSGYNVTIQLHSETFINKAGITSSTFRTIPDAPVGTFELTLPQGKFSALAANGNLCKSALKMPTAFTAQNGMTIKQSTPITATGCARHKAKRKASGHRKGSSHGKK